MNNVFYIQPREAYLRSLRRSPLMSVCDPMSIDHHSELFHCEVEHLTYIVTACTGNLVFLFGT